MAYKPCQWEYIPQKETDCGELLHCCRDKKECSMYKPITEVGWKKSPEGQYYPILKIDNIDYLIG